MYTKTDEFIELTGSMVRNINNVIENKIILIFYLKKEK